jgi:hypothetical protein
MLLESLPTRGAKHEVQIAPTNDRFSKSENFCDIHFFKGKTYPHINSVIRPIFSKNPFWIQVCNHSQNFKRSLLNISDSPLI